MLDGLVSYTGIALVWNDPSLGVLLALHAVQDDKQGLNFYKQQTPYLTKE